MPPRNTCANPLYYQWICELRDKYDEDSNQHLTFNKAAKSLMAYPEYLATPAEARKVKFVGPAVEAHLAKCEKKSGLSGGSGTSAAGPSRNAATSSNAPRRTKSTTSINSFSEPEEFRANASYASSAQRQVTMNRASSGSQAPAFAYAESMGAPTTRTDEVFQFCYLGHDPHGNEVQVNNHNQAFVNVELNCALLIEFPKTSRHPDTAHVEDIDTRPNRDCFVGYVPWAFADKYPESTWAAKWKATPALKRSTTDLSAIIAAENVAYDKRQRGGLDPSRQISSSRTWNPSSSSSQTRKVSGPSSSQASTSRNPPPALLARAHTMPMPPPSAPRASNTQSGLMARSVSTPGPSQNPPRDARRAGPRLSSAIPLLEVDIDIDIEDPYATTQRFEIPATFRGRVIPANHYDIVLILDNREKHHREDPEGIARELMAKGVRVERRALELGDVCWIAKRKPMFCDGTPYDEITLDIILERKRLDDLVQSITDGRFHEQKFRLHNSAITKVFYVVEEYKNGRLQDKNSFDLAIDTALSSTQVIDGFMVKETRSLDDTINYYWTMHRQILRRHSGKSLDVFPSEYVKRYNFLKFQKKLRHREPAKSYLVTFDQFQFLNSKSGFITVQETWARMLLCINGVSAEKAGELVKKYPTPRSMYSAFLEAEEEERMHKGVRKGPQARLMLENVGGNTGRRVGPALSGKIYDVLMGSRTVNNDDDDN